MNVNKFKKKSTVTRVPSLAHDVFSSAWHPECCCCLSHSFVVALSIYCPLSLSLILSPSLVLLCLLSSVWCWQADALHPLPATVLLLLVGLSNKPNAGRHRGRGEGSLRKRRRGTRKKSRRKTVAGEGSSRVHQWLQKVSVCNTPVRSETPLLRGTWRKKKKHFIEGLWVDIHTQTQQNKHCQSLQINKTFIITLQYFS